MHRIQSVAAQVVVGLTGAGTDESVDAVAEGHQAEPIALLFGGQPKQKRGGQELFQDRLSPDDAGGQPGCVDEHIDFLGPFDLEELGHGPAAFGRGLPMVCQEAKKLGFEV